jgi:hypothetical protein
MRAALCGGTVLMQIATWHLQHGLDVQIALALPQLEEIDLLRVAEQPGGFVIERLRTLLQFADAQGDSKTSALRTQTATRRNRGNGWRRERTRNGGRCHEH